MTSKKVALNGENIPIVLSWDASKQSLDFYVILAAINVKFLWCLLLFQLKLQSYIYWVENHSLMLPPPEAPVQGFYYFENKDKRKIRISNLEEEHFTELSFSFFHLLFGKLICLKSINYIIKCSPVQFGAMFYGDDYS